MDECIIGLLYSEILEIRISSDLYPNMLIY